MQKRRHTQSVVAGALLGSILLLAMIPDKANDTAFHSLEEYAHFAELVTHPPVDSSIIFPNAIVCQGCHGNDPLMFSMIDAEGNDVNVYDDWSSSMMANSAKDPFWRAKVSHEVLINPSHQQALETKCTSCHAPQGHFTAILRGAEHYSIDEMVNDTTAMDGVSCASCHMLSAENLGNQFSGEATYDTTRVIFGPYTEPFEGPMADFVGFEPRYAKHITDPGICANCHTLLTNSVDLDGNFTGDEFVEQATYHEWLNSVYADPKLEPITCQGCHMPRLEEPIVISANYLFLEGREPYGMHDLVGANTTMLKMMKTHRDTLGIQATAESFDETLEKTLGMLQQQAIELSLEVEDLFGDTLVVGVIIQNKAGHKFPSGYPSRRAFVQCIATDESGDTLFASGLMDENYEVVGQSDDTESHFDIIHSEDQVQIYEMVIGDVNGDFTTVLERAHTVLKDNRLPPRGFRTGHISYDTTRVYGAALTDPDFNFEDGTEGSGGDVVHYNIATGLAQGLVSVEARVYYQALPPKWMAPMFALTTPEIEFFRDMYDQADLSPVLVKEVTLDSIDIGTTATETLTGLMPLRVFPNPSNGKVRLQIDNDEILEVQIFYPAGGSVLSTQQLNEIDLPDYPGLYIIRVQTTTGNYLGKVVRPQ